MSKQIKLVYQDCPMCGARKSWGEEQTKFANDYGFEIVKTPFFKWGAADLIFEATRQGMSLPFFTDGVKFSKDLKDFAEEKTIEVKTIKKTKKVTEDGAISKTA